jgi:hypothetical protein
VAGIATLGPPDLPAPLFEQMLRLFKAPIDAVMLRWLLGIRWPQVVTMTAEPIEDMLTALDPEALGRFEAAKSQPGDILRPEFGTIQQAPEYVDLAAAQFYGHGFQPFQLHDMHTLGAS